MIRTDKSFWFGKVYSSASVICNNRFSKRQYSGLNRSPSGKGTINLVQTYLFVQVSDTNHSNNLPSSESRFFTGDLVTPVGIIDFPGEPSPD